MTTPGMMTSDAPERRKLRKTTTKAHRKALQDARSSRVASFDDVDDATTASRSSSNVVAGALSMTPTMSSASGSMLSSKTGRKLIVLRNSVTSAVDADTPFESRPPKSRGRKSQRDATKLSSRGSQRNNSNTKRSSRSRGSQFAREVTSELQWPSSEAQWSASTFDTSASDWRNEPVRLMTSAEQAGADALPRFSVSLFSACDVSPSEDTRQIVSERAAATRREFGYHSKVGTCDVPRSARAQSKESKIFSPYGSVTSARVAQELSEAAAVDAILSDVITTHLFHDPAIVEKERRECSLPRVSERCR